MLMTVRHENVHVASKSHLQVTLIRGKLKCCRQNLSRFWTITLLRWK